MSSRTTQQVNSPGCRIWLTLRGDGPPVVLLHGGPGTYDYLSESALGDWLSSGHTVVGYDQRGCRHSLCDGPFTVDANIADLEAIRRHLNVESLGLVGHSWGGLLAICYAAAHPKRVGHLVLIGTIGPRKGWEPAFWRSVGERHTPDQQRRLAEIDAELAGTRDARRRGHLYRVRYNVALPSYMAPSRRERARIEIESFNRLVGVNAMADMHRGRYADRSWEGGLADLAAPVTVVHGRQDPVPWSVVEDVVDMLPESRVAGVEECGHFPWLEQPEACRSAVLEAMAVG